MPLRFLPAGVALTFLCLALGPEVFAANNVDDESVAHHYDWLTNGTKSGALELTINREQSTRTVSFEFNDRGRGPKLSETTRFDAEGRVVELRISGNSYMGAPVEESFHRTASGLEWRSTSENGSSDQSAAFYLANDGSPEQTAQLARALLASPGGSLDLLPNGRASIRKLDAFEKSISSNKIALSLYAIAGIEMAPRFVWLDKDQELFGLSAGSSSLVPSGWISLSAELYERQNKAELEFYRAQSAPLNHQLPSRYAITNIDVVDVETGLLLENRSVEVRDGKIETVSEARPPGGDLLLIDGHGGTLIPGLWDMHTHISLDQGLLHLAAGVTTVRDMGNNPDNYQAVKARFDSSEVIGPHTFAAGVIERRSPYSAPLKALSDTLQDALALVDSYASMGYPQIKIYSSVEPDWVRPLAERAHAHGMRVSGHIPSFMTAERAVRDGFNEIQHLNMLFLNFLASPEDDTRTPLRFSRVAELGGSLDLDTGPVSNFVALLKDRNVVVDPTVAIFDNMFRHRSGQLSPSFEMVAAHFPPAVKRDMYAGRMDIDDQDAATYAASADALLVMIRMLYEAGIQIVAGTDSLAGFGLHRELELYQAAGIPAVEVLRLATLGAAQLMKVSATSGSIAAGKTADFVLLAESPLENISALRRPRMVFKGEKFFKPSELYLAVGIEPFPGGD